MTAEELIKKRDAQIKRILAEAAAAENYIEAQKIKAEVAAALVRRNTKIQLEAVHDHYDRELASMEVACPK